MREGYFQVRRRRRLHYNSSISAADGLRLRGVEGAMSTVLCMRGMRAACLNPGPHGGIETGLG